jgi:hypothetical protein
VTQRHDERRTVVMRPMGVRIGFRGHFFQTKEFIMIRLSLIAAALAVGTLHTVPAKAEPVTTLEECYNAVITWCVETFPEHAHQCGESSHLQECDDEFGNGAAMTLGRANIGPAISQRHFARLMTGVERRNAPVLRAVTR